jgi:hypothetical protein
MILRYSGRFYKVIKVRSRGDNNYTFECKDIDTKQSRTLEFSLSGFLEAAGSTSRQIQHSGAGGWDLNHMSSGDVSRIPLFLRYYPLLLLKRFFPRDKGSNAPLSSENYSYSRQQNHDCRQDQSRRKLWDDDFYGCCGGACRAVTGYVHDC